MGGQEHCTAITHGLDFKMQGHALETEEEGLRVTVRPRPARRCCLVPSPSSVRALHEGDDVEPHALLHSSWPGGLQIRMIREERSCPSGGDEKSWACFVTQKRG